MFEILPNPSLETILLVGRALLLVGAFFVFALAFIRWRRADERNNARLSAQLERAFGEVRSLHETVAVMSARLESMSERNEMDTRLAPAGGSGSQRGYDVAARLAKNGAGIDELIANSGVTRHEAELLLRLHSGKVRESAPPARTQRVAEQHSQTTSEQIWPTTAPTPAPKPAPVRKRGSLLSVVG